ncbi:FecR family protein [Pseudoxanthomonas wuyuanensis]|uniref:FecR family protein n=2 Tax=Pseudoxanthomonas wuyuanensis TaxID=1073196 RepID=A0A286D6M8_9GAMM|nr:FecR family protein [Pseudoxanthomonas wuyuanensis]
MRRVPLADGSTLTLNTESKVKVYDERGRLRVKVVRGEVFIEAAAGDEPLMIEIDGRHLDAHAAAFVVRKLDDQPAQVVVQDGNVEIPGGNAATNLTPNTRLLVQGKPGEVATVPLSADDLRRELAWREGKIAFQGETLADAARSFSRYSDTRLIIADTKLANEPVAGLFATSNPAGFARAVAAAFDAQVRQQDNEVIISRE